MKAIIIIVAMCAAYYGLNYFTLSQAAIERMVKKTYMPSKERVEELCKFIIPTTEVNYVVKVNDHNEEIASKSPETLCKYWKSYVPTKMDWQDVIVKKVKVEKINQFPYNAANAEIDVDLRYQVSGNRMNKTTRKNEKFVDVITIHRTEKLQYRRGFMGGYEYVKIDGRDEVTRPEEKKRR
ncbi:MAG: hypothetical protein J6M05_03515 [Cardiobacteriaceae bacterium]|nr:hypothetical protein [Cardiobacteriaceae bacterium]